MDLIENSISGWSSMADTYQRLSEISVEDIHLSPLGQGAEALQIIQDFKGKRFLELGCGAAQNTIACARKGGWSVGVDASMEQIRHAHKLKIPNGNSDVIRGDITSLDWIKSETFDWILSMFAIEFVSNIDEFFAASYRILRPDGRILFSTVHPLGSFQWDTTEKAVIAHDYFNLPVEIWADEDEDGKELNLTIFRTIEEIVGSVLNQGFKILRLLEPRALPIQDSDLSPYKGPYWEPYRERLEKIPFALVIEASK
ncbi:MAG: class I SAM-dependent methyltransferase [Dehalococcoidia bacterium]